ncbi:MAG: gliding motility-associated C-terminal domain-containing protein [Bacteroidetes bacterium]|nr:gliding motility-associated C-terminal domain-containing protein [Bacteroidota bacterium]
MVLTVTVNPAPTAVAGPTRNLTCAQTTTVLSGSGGGSYSWSGPGIVSGGTTATPTVNQAGTYSLIVTDAVSPFCPSVVSTVAVTANTTAPSPTASSPSTLTCIANTVTLNATGGGTYSWSGTGIVSGAATANPIVNGTGPYVVTVTAANGCTATANTSVAQNITPPTPTASNTATLTCATTTAALTATGGGTYNWSGTGIVSGGTTANPIVNGTGPYIVTVTAANGCTATANTSVAQNITPPTPTASNTSTLTCATTTAALTATGGGTYNWSGTGIVSGGTTANPIVNGTGPYVVTVTAANGCTATANTTVAQNITPPTPTASNSNSLNCSVTTATLTATGGGTYNWSGTGIVSGGTSANPIVNGTGPYVVTVTAANGCTATANTTVAQNITPPTPTASNSGSLTCTTTSVTLTGTSGGTYNWSGPGIVSGATTANPVVNLIGSYVVTVTAANGCTATANTTVSQNTTVPTVNAGTTQTLVCGVSSVTLTGSGSAGSSANWLGGVCGSATNYITTACAPGTYTLVATNNTSGCTNTSTVSVSSSTNVPQATVNAITNSITCTNSVVTIGVTYSGTDPVTYIWTGPGITGSTTSSVTTANLSGTYNVTITNTSSNCQSVYSAIVPLNTTPVPASVAPSASITCLTNTVSLNATPTGTNYAYSWSGPGTILNGTTENPTVNASGNYVVTMTDNINGCVGSFTVNVPSNTVSPTFTLGSASSVTTTCASPNATLSATSSTDPNTVYTWTTPSATTVTGTPISVSAAGIYTVVVTNTVNGCSTSSALSQATVEVIADSGIPVVTLASNSLSITCTNPTPSVAVTTTANPVSYNWTPTSGIVPGTETTANPVFTAAGSYSVIVTNTLSSCATAINANVVDVVLDNATPVISLSSAVNDGTITCTDPQVTITPTITSSTANLTYTWSPSGVTSSTINDATFTSAGVYTIAVTNTLTGCVSSSTNTANTFTVYLNNTPPTSTITAISTNSTIGCGGNSSTVTLSGASSSTNFTQTWLPGSATTSTLDVTTAGIYTLVVVDAVSGCSVTTEYTVSGSSTPPQNVDAGTNTSIPCGTPTVALNGTTTSTNVVTYDWSGPNSGSIVSGNTTSNPIVMDAGVYTLTVTDVTSGCSATATINVTAANVVASFTANPTSGISPLDVSFTDGSSGATAYSWNFGDSNTSTSQNPNHTFTTGTYTVILTVTSGPCIDTASVVIVVEDGLTLEIPNVFTPNGDGSNDIFHIKSTGVKEISLQIFNRWGQKLYEFAGPKASWDGLTPSGSEVPEGTYFYFVKATGFDGQEIEKHGTVNLFR